MESVARSDELGLKEGVVMAGEVPHSLPVALVGGIQNKASGACVDRLLKEEMEVGEGSHVEMAVHVEEAGGRVHGGFN